MLLTTLIWLATWLLLYLRLRKPNLVPISKGFLHSLWFISLVLHGALILIPWLESHTLSLSFLNTLSTVFWLSSFILFIAQLSRPLEPLGLFIIPLMLPVIIISSLYHHQAAALPLNNGLGIHIFLSLLAYSMLALAALQALVLAAQNRQLHNHQLGGLIKILPPLQDMEALLFGLIQVGLFLLSLGLISGFIYLDGFFGKQVAHKTILSILAWFTFSTLLFGHWRYGWRGRIAIRWTLLGFTLLMLAFFGSKFVLEYLIHST